MLNSYNIIPEYSSLYISPAQFRIIVFIDELIVKQRPSRPLMGINILTLIKLKFVFERFLIIC